MSRKIVTILTILLLTFAGCRKRVVISNDELAEIFKEAFITNVYASQKNVHLDSLLIYEPIFSKHGYTAEDVRYTIGQFSKKKSAALGTVIRKAEQLIQQEASVYARKVEILDTIRNVAIREGRRVLINDSLTEMKKLRDSVKFRHVIEPVYPGDYRISYESFTEENTEKYPRENSIYFEGPLGQKHAHQFMVRHHDRFQRTFTADSTCKKLIINLGAYKKKGVRDKKINFKIKDLEVEYIPTEEVAIDSLFERLFKIPVFDDGWYIEKDSI
ncbi:MAG: hypothetical protein KBS95_06505 [Alistipes sp.]|nr:hypothetical protein [Candidatus Alistipes equi]